MRALALPFFTGTAEEKRREAGFVARDVDDLAKRKTTTGDEMMRNKVYVEQCHIRLLCALNGMMSHEHCLLLAVSVQKVDKLSKLTSWSIL